MLHPVGPEPPGTYWLRRGVLAGAVLVIVILLAYACSGGSSKPTKFHPAAKTTPSVSTTLPESPTPTATKHGTPACGSAVTGAMSTGQPDYSIGATPTLMATLSNTGAHSCTLQAGQSKEIWSITSGKDHVWTTQGCAGSSATAAVTLKAHAERRVSTIWDGHRRDPHCAVGQPALAGTYVLQGTIDGIQTTPVVFRLH